MKKWYKIIFLLIVLLGVAILCITRWSAWFGNIPEPVYFVNEEPDNIVLLLDSNPQTQRMVTWRGGKQIENSYLILVKDSVYDTLPATGSMVASRSGKAAYYQVKLDSLKEGKYTYKVCSGDRKSAFYSFDIDYSDSIKFVVFGDIHQKDTTSIFYQFMQNDSLEGVSFMAYVGDLIERPTDYYWQAWFNSMNNRQAEIPQLAVPGNHEYLKGIYKNLDSRWNYIFTSPSSTSSGCQKGSTYYVDYPYMRIFMIDTDGLQFFSDYTVTQTWLNKHLSEADDKWKIVIMHHSIHSAGMLRVNPLVWHTFRRTLNQADVVFAGHDHSYLRHATEKKGNLSTPVFFVVNSSPKSYVPKCSPDDQRLGVNRTFYEEIIVDKNHLHIQTKLLATDEIYDDITIDNATDYVTEVDSLMSEILDLPEEGINSWKAKRYINSRSHRLNR